MHLDQHFIVLWGGLFHILEMQDIGRAVLCVNNRFHGILQIQFSNGL